MHVLIDASDKNFGEMIVQFDFKDQIKCKRNLFTNLPLQAQPVSLRLMGFMNEIFQGSQLNWSTFDKKAWPKTFSPKNTTILDETIDTLLLYMRIIYISLFLNPAHEFMDGNSL